jgi:hypothetical protein
LLAVQGIGQGCKGAVIELEEEREEDVVVVMVASAKVTLL